MPTSVLIVEDHAALAMALTMLFNSDPEFVVCGGARDVEDALEFAERTNPEFVTVDVNLPSGSGIDLLPRLKLANPRARHLVLSQEDPMVYAARAREVGADGYLRKGASSELILEVAHRIMSGEQYFPGLPAAGG